MAKRKPKRKRLLKKAPIPKIPRPWWWEQSINPFIPTRSRKQIQEEAALERAHVAKARIDVAIPGITDLIAAGELLVTQTFMKRVTNVWQKERLVKAVILGKLNREP